MKTWAILPVKMLDESKSRLTAVLSPDERAQLVRELLLRTLGALAATADLSGVLVVSRDTFVQTLAHHHGAEAIAEGAAAGLNGAAALGLAHVHLWGASHALVLPTDLPFVTAAAITAMLPEHGTAVRLCSDHLNYGTNALCVPTDSGFRFSFGEGSFERHLAEAVRLDLPTRIINVPALQFDLDTPEDWAKYQEKEVPATPGD